jgi:non-heme chloroperoxidase
MKRAMVFALCCVSGIGAGAAELAVEPLALEFRETRAPDGVPLNVVTAGNRAGPGVLFVHGFTQSYMSFLPQLSDASLRDAFALAAVDMRGHGASGKPWDAAYYSTPERWAGDIQAAIAASGRKRVTLVGWSFGGYCIMDYVRRYGTGDVDGIVLVGSHGGLLPRVPVSGPLPTDDLDKAIEYANWFMSVMGATPLPSEQVARGKAANLMLPPYARRAMVGRRLNNRDLAKKLDIPILLLRGERDPVLTESDMTALLALLPTARARTYAELGHSPFGEDPAAFNADIARFVRDVAR